LLTWPCVSRMFQPVTTSSAVGHVVAIGVFQVDRFAPFLDDRAAAVEGDRRGDAQLLGEDGELVGPAVAVGVFTNANAVAAFAFALQFVGIVVGLADPQPAPLVPGGKDRLAAELGFGDEEFRLEIFRRDEVLERFLGVERLLHLLLRSAHRPPPSAGGVDRHVRRLKLKRLHVGPLGGHLGNVSGDIGIRRDHARIVADRPANAPFDKVHKTRVAPGSLVVAPGGVEHASLALRANPRPRFFRWTSIAAASPAGGLFTPFEDRAVLLIVLGVDVGLVPAFEAAESPGESDARPHRPGSCETCRCRAAGTGLRPARCTSAN
jgi:hypothetical protein